MSLPTAITVEDEQYHHHHHHHHSVVGNGLENHPLLGGTIKAGALFGGSGGGKQASGGGAIATTTTATASTGTSATDSLLAGGLSGSKGVRRDDVLRGRFPTCLSYWPRRWTIFLMLTAGNLMLAPLLSVTIVPMEHALKFDNAFIGHLHSAFFYGFCATQVVGGYVADRYGGKWCLFFGFFGMAVLTALTPTMAHLHWTFILSRVLMGIAEGFQGPAIHNICAHWIPQAERSTMMGFIRSGMYGGSVVAFMLAPWLLKGGDYGWQLVWYANAGLTFLWCAWWFLYGASSPQTKKQDTRISGISEQEVAYIEETAAHGPVDSIPYMKLLRSPAVLGIIAAHFCHDWGWYVMISWMPKYYSEMHHTHIQQASFFSAIPFLIQLPCTMLAGSAGSALIKRLGLRVVHVRRAFSALGLLGPALCYGLSQYAPSAQWALVCVGTAFALDSFNIGGYMINNIDISPKYAGSVKGLADTFGCVAGVVGNIVTGAVVHYTHNYHIAFLIIAGLNVAAAVIYLATARGEVLFD